MNIAFTRPIALLAALVLTILGIGKMSATAQQPIYRWKNVAIGGGAVGSEDSGEERRPLREPRRGSQERQEAVRGVQAVSVVGCKARVSASVEGFAILHR